MPEGESTFLLGYHLWVIGALSEGRKAIQPISIRMTEPHRTCNETYSMFAWLDATTKFKIVTSTGHVRCSRSTTYALSSSAPEPETSHLIQFASMVGLDN
jgi:hypothetical protein